MLYKVKVSISENDKWIDTLSLHLFKCFVLMGFISKWMREKNKKNWRTFIHIIHSFIVDRGNNQLLPIRDNIKYCQ